mmetsp:Transcript_29188/g.56393  ORF Transcript_29188/g.56393 Transcript_29188/m.56393 type:complete len:328 (-) Transcript_29188:1838-2821(-)
MGGGDGGDHCNMGPRHFGQRCDFAGVVHPDLDHRIFGVGRHTRQGQRHAPMIVVAGDRGMGPPLIAQHGAQHFLGRSFTDRASDGDDARLGPGAGGGAERFQPLQHVWYNQQRRVLGHALGHMSDKRGGSAVFQRLGHKIMAVAGGLQRDKEIARFKRARIDRHACCGPIGGTGAPGSGHSVVPGPEHHVNRPSNAATATLACSASSKGRTSSPTIWPVSWPLPAMSRASPGSSTSTARRIASARSPTSVASGQPAITAARMVAGSSLRGLSSVTKTTSAFSAAACPIKGRLPASRSPPAPTMATSLPITCGRMADRAVPTASGVWA